jgi:hypothetical protein
MTGVTPSQNLTQNLTDSSGTKSEMRTSLMKLCLTTAS